jgi:hypothetical protein
MSDTFDALVMDGPKKGERLVHFSPQYELQEYNGLSSIFSGLDGPLPRTRVWLYAYTDGTKYRPKGWYLM